MWRFHAAPNPAAIQEQTAYIDRNEIVKQESRIYNGMPGAGAGEEIAKRGDPASLRIWHSYVGESSSGGNWTPRLKNLELSVSFTALIVAPGIGAQEQGRKRLRRVHLRQPTAVNKRLVSSAGQQQQ